jgi:hypothetical protein
MTAEFERIHDQDEPAQGDLIEWIGTDHQVPWNTFAVVVTADCDIAWNKNRGILSYVPALVAEDFIWEHWRKDRLGTQLPSLIKKAATRISRWRQKFDSAAADLSPEAVEAWLTRAKPVEIIDELGVEDNGERANLLNVLEPAELVMQTLQCVAPDFKLLNDAFCCINPKALVDDGIIVNEVQKSWGALPGDVFHLPSMPEEATNRTAGGLFLMLRNIRQIDASYVTARPDDVRTGNAKAKRIARVTAPYRYAITQNLARVFADIGLPEDHETRRKHAAQRLFESQQPA